MFLVARLPVFTARPSRRALAAQPKLYFADTGIAMTFRPNDAARAMPNAVGAAREGLVYQHLAAWCNATRDARLWTWRTTGGVEVDFVVETADALTAIEVRSGTTLRPATALTPCCRHPPTRRACRGHHPHPAAARCPGHLARYRYPDRLRCHR